MPVITRVLSWIFEALSHAPSLDDADAYDPYHAIEFHREPTWPVPPPYADRPMRSQEDEIRRRAG